MGFLVGKRTYIVAAAGVIFNGLVASGYIDESQRETVNSLLTFLGLGTLRKGMKG